MATVMAPRECLIPNVQYQFTYGPWYQGDFEKGNDSRNSLEWLYQRLHSKVPMAKRL